jgi:hypothetical protein
MEKTMDIQVSGLLGLIILILDVWAIVKVVQSGTDNLAKAIWVVVILLLPVLGLLIWLLFGPRA